MVPFSPEKRALSRSGIIGETSEPVQPSFKTLLTLNAAISALSVAVPATFGWGFWPLSVTFGFLAFCWTIFSFSAFGRRGWWALATATPALLWLASVIALVGWCSSSTNGCT